MVNPTQANSSHQSFQHSTVDSPNPIEDKKTSVRTSPLDQLRHSPTTAEHAISRPTRMSLFASQKTTAEQLVADENTALQVGSGVNGSAKPTAETGDAAHANSTVSAKINKQSTPENHDNQDKKGASRFEGDKEFDAIAQGSKILKKDLRGDDVKKVQQALIDMGYHIPGGASGIYDQDTQEAVKRFQLDTGNSVDGKVGRNTLKALKQHAPASDAKLVRSAEYDKLFADGRLDITIAVGYDEKNNHLDSVKQTIQGLKADGYKPIDYGALSNSDRGKMGLTKDRYDPNAQYFHKTFKDTKTGKEIDSVVRLVEPSMGGNKARASFKKALEQDEVVLYSGHARYGTGPDFDHKTKGDGNFVINERGNQHHEAPPKKLKDAIKGRNTDLDQIKAHPNYQLLIMNGCSTVEYMPNLRSAIFKDRTPDNTDIVITNNTTWVGTSSKHNLAFLKGITERQTQPQMAAQHNKIETDYSTMLNGLGARTRHGRQILPDKGYNTYSTNGFFGNEANQQLPK
jgi:peptidoglycan hydrolase-like protein with peptidoglycan-binding domain